MQPCRSASTVASRRSSSCTSTGLRTTWRTPLRVLEVISRIAGISLAKFRLREGLLASEERYRILFEESPDPIVLMTPDSVPVAANRAALELYNTDFET